MAVAYNSRIVTDGLVLALDAGNPKSYPGSGTTWTDLSGRGNNGTLTNAPTYSSADGGSIALDGTDDYILVNSSVRTITNNFTNEIWYKATGGRSKTQLFSSRIFAGGGTSGSGYMIGNGGTSQWKLTKFNILDIFLGTVPNDTNWHCISVTFSSTGGVSLYQDGVYVGNNANTANVNVDFTLVRYGAGGGGLADVHQGNIGICKLYNRVLTATEIRQNFNAARSRYGI